MSLSIGRIKFFLIKSMRCPNCKRDYSSGKFCPECGSPLVSNVSFREIKPDLFGEARKFEWGIGAPQDIEKAAQLYLEAAENGNTDAMCHIGYLMLFELGIARNIGEAIRWMESGLTQTTNPDSPYCQTARRILGKVQKQEGGADKVSSFVFGKLLGLKKRELSEDDLRERLQRNIYEYDSIAAQGGFLPLLLVGNDLQGTAVDDISRYPAEERRYYQSLALIEPKNNWGSDAQFCIGRLGYQFLEIVRGMITLGIG